MTDSARLAEMAEAIIRRLYETDALSGGDYNTLLNATRALWETKARIDHLVDVGDILHDIIAPATNDPVARQLDIWNDAVAATKGRVPGHGLTHVRMEDGSGRFAPACTCGWWSPNCSHSDYERHVRKAQTDGDGSASASDRAWREAVKKDLGGTDE